jgi:NADH-quinone oxidoreductase subunit N
MPLDLDQGRHLALALLPELILTGWALLLTLHAAWRHREPGAQRQVGWLAVLGTAVAAAAVIALWTSGAKTAGLPGSIGVDAFRWAAALIVLLGTALATVLAIGYLDREGITIPEYHVLVLFAAIGMLFMVAGTDLLVIFLGLETMSVSVYALAGINRRSQVSAEAALKYFLMGAFASAFFLYGVALLYGATGSTKLAIIGVQASGLDPGVTAMFWIGVALLFVGFAFKIAAVPFHMWAPDVYDGAPTSVTVFMAATVKAAAFAAFARVLLLALPTAQPTWAPALWWLAAVTMIAGNLMALAQRSLKRMLAYSSIAHAGYLLAALVPGSVAGAGALLFYILFYTLTTVAAFSVLIAKGRGGERDVVTDDLAGLAESDPLLALVMAISMLSLLGFPGTAGFMGKWYILSSATGGGFTALAVVLVLTSVVSAGYYLPVIMAMYMKPRAHERVHAEVALASPMRGVLVALVVALLVFGVWPNRALDAARTGARVFLPHMPATSNAHGPAPSGPTPHGH